MLDELTNQAADLALYAHTALPLALATPMSAASDFFQSAAFSSFRKSQEGKQKLSLALLGRFDGIAKQINGLAKVLARR